jgi:hypothetical protein
MKQAELSPDKIQGKKYRVLFYLHEIQMFENIILYVYRPLPSRLSN